MSRIVTRTRMRINLERNTYLFTRGNTAVPRAITGLHRAGGKTEKYIAGKKIWP